MQTFPCYECLCSHRSSPQAVLTAPTVWGAPLTSACRGRDERLSKRKSIPASAACVLPLKTFYTQKSAQLPCLGSGHPLHQIQWVEGWRNISVTRLVEMEGGSCVVGYTLCRGGEPRPGCPAGPSPAPHAARAAVTAPESISCLSHAA